MIEKVSETIRFSLVKRAQFQDNFYLRDLRVRVWRITLLKRMTYSMFKVLFDLEITNIKRLKIVVEVEARKHFTF
jgi:hypothetical protein